MAESATVARPYAKAIYGLAQENGKSAAWLKELEVLTAVSVHPKVAAALADPEKSGRERGQMLLELADAQQTDALLQNFVAVLSENGRLSFLPEIFAQYRELVLAEDRVREAVVYSAYPIDGKELEDLQAALEKKLGTKLRTSVVVDSGLIGGVKVEFGDQVLDMSVQQQLNALYAAMIN